VGIVDGDGDHSLYDRTMGCQIRAAREIKKDEVMMTMPRSAMVTPDLVASSDAARAVLACCKAPEEDERSFWDAFENTTVCESKFGAKVSGNTGPQLLVKILQERKKVEGAFNNRAQKIGSTEYVLAEYGKISTRAPVLAFLIHQRFFNSARPDVVSESNAVVGQFQKVQEEEDGNALKGSKPIVKPPGSPNTFAPYARTLPSSLGLPLCWKRNELAPLAACVSGVPILQEVASRTMQLASEFMALLDAGIIERFSGIFPEGLLTWERWVWAAALMSSRNLPVSCYLNNGEKYATNFVSNGENEIQSPGGIWNELGVMIPLLDMLNHEIEAHQVTWQPCVPVGWDLDAPEGHPPRAIVHKKVRKGSEIFCCYGANLSNQNLILQYGFAQMHNPCDEVRIGWALSDAVGNVEPPPDHSPLLSHKSHVYESTDSSAISAWWTEDRFELLRRVAFARMDDQFMESIKSGKKLSAVASSDGSYNPILLTATVIATMPSKEIEKQKYRGTIVISKEHQHILQNYLHFLFTRKMEKLLQNLANGLKAHFNLKLWTKASHGGLRYKPEEGSSDDHTGWQSFFDSRAYLAAMEVEKKYYAMGTDSCVLTLYDGHLRSLSLSAQRAADDEKFRTEVWPQLGDLGFRIANGSEAPADKQDSPKPTSSPGNNGSEKKSRRDRKRNRKKNQSNVASGDRPPAMKLHVGNLSYSTTPSDLYDFFSSLYGKDNILECHIPVERSNGRSRGFGFVTMPEKVAQQVLQSGQKHEIDGRLLKVAKSNSAGTSNSGRAPSTPPALPSDRCVTCGYRPKYCVCAIPRLPRGEYRPSARSRSPPASEHPLDYGRDYSYYGSRDSYRDDRYGDPSPHYDRADRYGRDYYSSDPYASRYDDRSSRSYERGEERYRERSRSRRDRERGRSRSSRSRSSGRRRDYEEGRSARRDRKSDDGEYDAERKRSGSHSRERSRRKKSKKHHSRNRSRSRSRSPGYEGK